MSTFLHQTPGRIRVRTSLIRKNSDFGRSCLTHMQSLDFVEDATVNFLTGSLTVWFDPTLAHSADVIKEFNRLGLLAGVVGFPFPKSAKYKKLYAQNLQKEAINQLVRLLLPLMVEHFAGKAGKALVQKVL